MDTDEYENMDDFSIARYKTYNDFLDKFVSEDDRKYLEDEDLIRDVKHFHALNKGDIKSEKDFDEYKRKYELMDHVDEKKEKPLYSAGKTFEEGTFLWHLATREHDVRSNIRSTIIFIRYRENNGREVSGYIDYRDRLQTDNFEDIFNGKKDLVPRPSDLSYYNWSLTKISSIDSAYYKVDAGPKERLSFRNNTDRKIINVDLEFLEKNKNSDVKRIVIDIPRNSNGNEESDKKNKKKADFKKNNKDNNEDPEREDKKSFGYKQIVIFDYETRSK